MTPPSIQTFTSSVEAIDDIAHKVSTYLQAATGAVDATDASSVPVLFLISGGSSLDIFQHIVFPADTTAITLSVLDERYSTDTSVSNFAQLAGLKNYDAFRARGGYIIDTRIVDNETLLQNEQKFEASLRHWRRKFPMGKVMIIQGMGIDGHTAGIMPYPESTDEFRQLFENNDQWVRGYDAGEKNNIPLRFTVTLNFLLQEVDMSFVLLIGQDKSRVFEEALKNDNNYAVAPIAVVQHMKSVYVARVLECA